MYHTSSFGPPEQLNSPSVISTNYSYCLHYLPPNQMQSVVDMTYILCIKMHKVFLMESLIHSSEKFLTWQCFLVRVMRRFPNLCLSKIILLVPLHQYLRGKRSLTDGVMMPRRMLFLRILCCCCCNTDSFESISLS